MRKFTAALLALIMAASLCACRDISYDEDKSPVPRFDLAIEYSFDDETLSEGDTVYYTRSLGTATVRSDVHGRAAEPINASLAELYAKFSEDADYTKRVAADQPEGEIIALGYRCTPWAERCDTRVLSLVFDVAQNLGGVHDSLVRFARSYDAYTGDLLSLDDVAKNTEQLKTFIGNYVIGLAGGEEYMPDGASILFPEFEETIKAIVADGQQWYFDERGLVVYANPYDIAPYSYGILCFTVPYTALEEFMDADYMPPLEHEGENGMMLAEAGESFKRDGVSMVGSVTVGEDAQSVILSAEETVYDIKLYSADRMLWQRNYMTDGEAMELMCFIPDVVPNIMLEYRLADGTVINRGIFQSGKDGSILLVEMSEDELATFYDVG